MLSNAMYILQTGFYKHPLKKCIKFVTKVYNIFTAEKIMTEFSDLNLCPINNRQGIVIDGEDSKVICKD